MSWERWTKAQLRKYLCRKVDLEKIEQEIYNLKNEVFLSSSTFDPTRVSRIPFRNGSVVEFSVIRREKIRKKLENEKDWLIKRNSVIEKALDRLTPLHRKIIDRSFFTLSCRNNKDLAEIMNLPYWSIQTHKRAALGHLFDDINQGYKELWEIARKEALCTN